MSEVTPITANFGADIARVDLNTITDADFEFIYRTWLDYGVLRFRDQQLEQSRVGLEVEEFAKLPSWLRRPAEVRRFFNTKLRGKSSQGHTFPDELTESQKRAVLEYLKTL